MLERKGWPPKHSQKQEMWVKVKDFPRGSEKTICKNELTVVRGKKSIPHTFKLLQNENV
jgi:hypothetical protein